MKVLIMSLGILISASTFATEINCKSKNYGVFVTDGIANYSVGKYVNDSADVVITQYYKTANALAISLEVDGQENHFEVVATKTAPGIFKGKLFMANTPQAVECKVK